MRYFDYQHIVGFEETNLVGNVYYVNHLRWQGRCREMFLRTHCPEIVEALSQDLVLATTRCACEYLAELTAFNEVTIRMRLVEMVQNRITMRFEYYLQGADAVERLIAKGEQQIACMRRDGESVLPIPIPTGLRESLEPYQI